MLCEPGGTPCIVSGNVGMWGREGGKGRDSLSLHLFQDALGPADPAVGAGELVKQNTKRKGEVCEMVCFEEIDTCWPVAGFLIIRIRFLAEKLNNVSQRFSATAPPWDSSSAPRQVYTNELVSLSSITYSPYPSS